MPTDVEPVAVEAFAGWLRGRGYRVVKTASSHWYEAATRIYQSFPYHSVIEPSEEEIQRLLRQTRAIALRYSRPFSQQRGALSYHVVYRAPEYDLTTIAKRTRSCVRRGLESCTVEPITFQQLAEDGWALRRDTLLRQGRARAETEDSWRQLCLSAAGIPAFEAWAAVRNGTLSATLLGFTCGDCVSILFQQSRTDELPHMVNHALTFLFTKEVIGRPSINRVFYGLHSLDAPDSVDYYKFGMAYEPQKVLQRVEFHPGVAPLVNRLSLRALTGLARLQSGSPRLTKARGMVEFYLQGRMPFDLRPTPGALSIARGSAGEREC